MRHRAPLLLVVALAASVACGDDGPQVAGTLPPVETAPAGYELPTGADEVVIAAGYDGGFAPPGAIFARSPLALITGDGRALATGPVPEIHPVPLLPRVQERTITPAAVQQLVAKADQLGLLRDVDYARDDLVADAPDAIVEITVGGRTYHHRAYALGIDDEAPDPDRQHLLEFVTALTDLVTTVGADALGAEHAFTPDHYLIQATPTDLATLETDIEPTIVAWPDDAPVRLADAATCAALPAAVAAPLFEPANARTYFTEGDVTYYVAAVQQVPGRAC